MLQFVVDEERCIQCGECVNDCPAGIIELDELPVITDESRCIRCQHCLAVCPEGAVSILSKDPDLSTELAGNLPEPEQMAALIKGRRSVRRYKDEDVDSELLDSLMQTVWHAPTGVNAQQVLLTLIGTRSDLSRLREEVYERLENYFESREGEEGYGMQFLKFAVKMRQERGADIIFRGAPHALIVSAAKSSPCPVQDTHIALSYFELMAQSLGLGTLWNGMLMWCINDLFPDLKSKMGIPEDHLVGYAMVFGRPDVRYYRTVQRGPATVNKVRWS